MPRRFRKTAAVSIIAATILHGHPALAAANAALAAVCADGACTVTYETAFFDLYAPITALDMVRNVPGFVLDNGNRSRGFGAAAGNVLIDGERVSSKSERPSDLLSRIPAADVERVLLIRGQAGGLDLAGQAVVVNVIRRARSTSGAWALGASNFQPGDGVFPYGELTWSAVRGASAITIGLEAEEYRDLRFNDERVLEPDRTLRESRDETSDESGEEYGLFLNATFASGRLRYGLNVALAHSTEAGGETSIRSPSAGLPFQVLQGETENEDDIEIGADVERELGGDWQGKAIVLYRRADSSETGSLVRGAPGEPGISDVETASSSLDTEAIVRFELDYSGLPGHLLEASVEGARNRLESAFELRERIGGELVLQEVPGANTEVEETRIDLLISDSFRLGSLLVDAALGGEASSIAQTGGFAGDRSFFFLKPSLTLTYAPDSASQLRMRLLREVGQLDFSDFVSAADLGDLELALGNPELSPETTVTLDLTVERRFGPLGTVSFTVFHDWIDDVEDVLPLEGSLEIPGNIGSGRRGGMRGELTLPLDSLGFVNARLDATGEWQTSRVTDPLTGDRRKLSDERGWEAEATLRQDLERAKLAWGLTAFAFDGFPEFGLDEFDRRGRRVDFDAFIETRVIDGMRIRFGAENLRREGASRDRQVYAGPRNVSPQAFRELRDTRVARELFVEVSGGF